MKVLILAGGFATRLRPLSCARPKILFPIVNKPLLQWMLERLAKNKIEEAIMAINYQTEIAIKQAKIPQCGLRIRYSRDPISKPLGSGGPIKKAEKILGHDGPFLVLNGDIFADISYSELLKKHEEGKAIATIALTRVEDPSHYGVVELAKNGRITRFVEKPSKEEAPSNLINAGVYVLSPEIFDYIPAGRKVSMEREVFTKLVEENKLYGHVFTGLWSDIGKLKDYLQVNKMLLHSAFGQQKLEMKSQVLVKKPVAFDKNVSVGKGSTIGPDVILGRNVTVGKDAYIKDSIIFPETVVSDFCSIDGAIIGDSVIIGKGVKIEKGCVLADHVKIKDNVTLSRGVSVCPAKEITENVSVAKNIC